MLRSCYKWNTAWAYSPESNGKDERLNRTLLLDATYVPHHVQLWAEAVNTACYIRNRLHSTATSDSGKTPFEVLVNKKPDLSGLSHVRMFGSKAFVHIPKAKWKGKLKRPAKVGYLVGFERDNSYRVYLHDEKKVIVSRDVRVDDNVVMNPKKTVENSSNDENVEFDDPVTPFVQVESSHQTCNGNDKMESGKNDVEQSSHVGQDDDQLMYVPGIRRSSRIPTPPQRHGYDAAMLVQQTCMHNDDATSPLTFEEALSGHDKEEWKTAMDEEMLQFDKMQTWRLTVLPEGSRTVKNRWVFITK